MNALLLRFADCPPILRWGSYALVAAVAFGLLWALAASPLWDRALIAAERAGRAEETLGAARDSLARARPPPPDAAERIRALRDEMWPESERYPAGYASGLLTALSRAAEEAGAASPLFNLASETVLEGPPLAGARAYAITGEFAAGTRTVTRFLESIGELRGPLLVDSLRLVRTLPRNEAWLRIRAFGPPAGE